MGSQSSATADRLIDFSFYQLIEILAKKYGVDIEDLESQLMEESLFQFSSNPQINFPTSDIEKIRIIEKDMQTQIDIVVNFLGLQGASGPLPGSVLNEIAYESHNQETIKATYLDFFNHHLIALLHSIWRKYKYYIQFKKNVSDEFSQKILGLIGVNRKHITAIDINWSKLLFYIGIIQSNVRTAKVIAEIIQHYFDLETVTIDEHERQLITIDQEQRNQLGSKNMQLGDNFVIGSVITSFTNKFKINFHNLDTEQFQQFLPTGKKYKELKEIIRFLLKDQLPYDLCLGLHPKTQSNFVLGNEQSSFLGWSTLLNSDPTKLIQMEKVTITGQA
ncbi:type VI secretion system baseplate subunit TssG [Exercitatus varius]|uniref:Type VI secretion system baseplate subunit TssG n=1 Tax=Exercitatus varius TaxID=67857 RepID=A0AAW6QBG8_9PAST|nr:type VI secretion system baseplate subunit TssG [Exercitatus varius]MDG2949455.1 type VI secretion system baseplate subunit TssG [Exercitatus varius]